MIVRFRKMSTKLVATFLAIIMLLSTLPISAIQVAAASEAQLTIDTVSAIPGETVELVVTLSNAPDVKSMAISNITFDTDKMTLTNVEWLCDAEIKNWNAAQGRGVLTFGENTDANGPILKMTFQINSVVEDSDIVVSCAAIVKTMDENGDEVSVPATVLPGRVEIRNEIPGDMDSDKKVNSNDAVYLLYHTLFGKEDYPIKQSGDIDGNGKTDSNDAVYLLYHALFGEEEYPITKCAHSMIYHAEKAATCTENGNIGYWECSKCNQLFEDKNASIMLSPADVTVSALGHTIVIDYAVPPTATGTGLTEGSHCSTCGYVEKAQEVIPALGVKTHEISYDIANGDPYLEKLLKNGEIQNPNLTYYVESEGMSFKNLSVPGYLFLGWYDLPQNGTLIKKIEAGSTDDIELYANWEKIVYTVQYKSSLFVDRAQDTYTVDTGLVLPTPKLSSYTFVGWSDEEGKLLSGKTIPVGTTGHMILDGNWTSERNKTWTKPVLDAPIIDVDEENGVILFAYEIGEIQNVPLYTIKNFGYIAGDGITKTETVTYRVAISETEVKAYSKAAAKATTESSDWTLSSQWNETTEINEEWCKENGKNIEDTETIAKSDSKEWNISNSKSGSTETSTLTTNQEGWKNEVKVNATSSETDSESSSTKKTDNESWNVDAKLTYTPRSFSFGIDVFEKGGVELGTSGGWGGEIGGGYEHQWGEETTDTEEHSETTSSGLEMGGSVDKSSLKTDSTVTTASWNSSSSYGGSSTNTNTVSNTKALSEKISNTYGYGSSYSTGEEAETSRGIASTQSDSETYSSSVTYTLDTSEEITSEWTTQATKPGYHRWVIAGTAHVFAIVGYDMSEKAYFVSTYSVIDDETHEFEDYSFTTASYDDHENGVISFAIPFEVAEYVEELTSCSESLKVDQSTGFITQYTGTDDCVVIPEYYNVGNGDVVKIVGFTADAFKGNTNIVSVVLSDFITEIPANAFKGCTSLKEISGGNVSKIGDYAFDGCTDAEDLGVNSKIKSLGRSAFRGVQRIIVNAANAQVAQAAAASGAEQIILSLEYLEEGAEAMKGVELCVPVGTKFFEMNGNYKTYQELSVDSQADISVFNKINFAGTTRIPVKLTSAEVVMNQSSVSASGLGLVLASETTHLGLQDTVTIQSSNDNAMLAKSLSLYEINKNVVGKLVVKNKLLQCGSTEASEHLSYVDYQAIDLATFNNMLNSFTLYFDANGGTCTEASRSVANSTKVGTLPTPTREHYTFVGWFLEDDTEVTADSVFSTGADITVYAHWTPVPYKVSWNTGAGYSIEVERTSSPNAGATIGALKSGDAIYYGDVLNVTYTASTGYTLTGTGTNNINVSGDVTSEEVYATAELNIYTVSWETGIGYTIGVNRTSSPNAGAATGALESGDVVYYGDVLAISYSANTGYTLKSNGKTSVTVTEDVTETDIFASAEANSYTYNIVYKSSNGTALGTATATYKFDTTNTITPPAKSGYNTPAAQTIVWDSTDAKTITFSYTPATVASTKSSGQVYNDSGSVMSYSATVEHRNRTATSVQIRVTWTITLTNGYNNNAIHCKATVGSVTTGGVKVVSQGSWGSGSGSGKKTATASSGWITVSLGTTNATSVSLSAYCYQANANGTDLSPNGYGKYSGTWTIALPAY